MRLWQKIVISVVAMEILGGATGFLTAASIPNWYATLNPPTGNPPNWLFGPVWSLLYAMIGTSFALIWHRADPGDTKNAALRTFFLQLLLNLAWTPVFFGLHQIGVALFIILALLAAIIVTITHFRRIDHTAALLMLPYSLWVSYASYLNAGYWVFNR